MSIFWTYLITFVIIATWTFVAATAKGRSAKQKRNLYVGASMMMFAFIANIIYTGMLGWNHIAASSLEWVLDIIDAILFYGGVYLMFKGAKFQFKMTFHAEEK